MKKLIGLTLGMAVSLTSLTMASMSHANTGKEIEFLINGVNSSDGKLYIQLFKGEANYVEANAYNATIVPAQQGTTKVVFYVNEPGEYALRYFHDENDNGQMETNMFGIPTEGYGFSNNAQPNFGPASYSQIKFVVAAEMTKITNESEVIY